MLTILKVLNDIIGFLFKEWKIVIPVAIILGCFWLYGNYKYELGHADAMRKYNSLVVQINDNIARIEKNSHGAADEAKRRAKQTEQDVSVILTRVNTIDAKMGKLPTVTTVVNKECVPNDLFIDTWNLLSLKGITR